MMFTLQNNQKMGVSQESVKVIESQQMANVENKKLGSFNAIRPSLLDQTFLNSGDTFQFPVVCLAVNSKPCALILGGSSWLRAYVASVLTGNTIIDETADAGSELHQNFVAIQSSIESLAVECQLRVVGSTDTPIINSFAYQTKGTAGIVKTPQPASIPGQNLNTKNQAVNALQYLSEDRCVVLILKDGTHNIQVTPAQLAMPI